MTTKELYEAIQATNTQSWTLLHKIGKEATFEDFQDYLDGGELPAVTLTSQEMAALQGGRKCRCTEAETTSPDCKVSDRGHLRKARRAL